MAYRTRRGPLNRVRSPSADMLPVKAAIKRVPYMPRVGVSFAIICKRRTSTTLKEVMLLVQEQAERAGAPLGPRSSYYVENALRSMSFRDCIVYDPKSERIEILPCIVGRLTRTRKCGKHITDPAERYSERWAAFKREFRGLKLTSPTTKELVMQFKDSEQKRAADYFDALDDPEADPMDVDEVPSSAESDTPTEPAEETRASGPPFTSGFVSPKRPAVRPEATYPTPDSADRRRPAPARFRARRHDSDSPLSSPTDRSPPPSPTPMGRNGSGNAEAGPSRQPSSRAITIGGDGGADGVTRKSFDDEIYLERISEMEINLVNARVKLKAAEAERDEAKAENSKLREEIEERRSAVQRLETSIAECGKKLMSDVVFSMFDANGLARPQVPEAGAAPAMSPKYPSCRVR